MAVNLINGDGVNAVYASQDADWYAALTGQQTTILDVNQNLDYELMDNNHLVIKSGLLVTKEGRRVQINVGDTEEIVIPTGTQNVNRYYICGFKLETDEHGVQSASSFIEQMSSGTDTIEEETFKDGATVVYISLYRLLQTGITISTVERLVEKRSATPSYIGMLVPSTTLDTEEKVIALFGGNHWIAWDGCVIRGARSGVTVGQATPDGGSDTITPSGTVGNHKLTVSEIPGHYHVYTDKYSTSGELWYWKGADTVVRDYLFTMTGDSTRTVNTNSTGGGGNHNHPLTINQHTNLPQYKNAYVWERVS